ncbi:MAG: permease, partial [Verrucomicrobia bacterium]|nr:permease [Verrucomicrobiota bacterium]
MLATFSVSLVLALLSWSLFHTIFLSQPDFDPKGEYLLLTSANALIVDGNHSSGTELQAYKSAEGLFADFAEVSLYSSIMLRTPTGGERYLGALLSSRALQIVGAKPMLGRLFTRDDDKRGAPPVILLSQRLWENNFKSDPAIVGKTIDAFGDQVTVVGVMPRGFRFPNDQDLWFSFGDAPDFPRYQVQQALVKLKPGVSRQRAEQDLQMILTQLGPESPSNKYGRKVALRPVRELFLMPQIRISALILFSLALIFVMVSCANAANLMLIDFLGRRAEIATSLALGIPRRAAIRAVCFQVTVIAAVAATIALVLLPLLGPVLYDRIKII